SVPEPPRIGWISGIEERRRTARYISQLNVLVFAVVIGVGSNGHIERTIMNFAENDRPHQWSRISCANRARGLDHDVIVANAGHISSTSNAVSRSSETITMGIPRQVDAIRRKQPHVIAQGTETKAVRTRAKLRLCERDIAARRNVRRWN